MFYCDKCASERDWPSGWPHPQSVGPCEVCGKTRTCTDIPSSALPIPKRRLAKES